GDDVELPETTISCGESWMVHRVAQRNLSFHVVQEAVHSGDRERRGVDFLAVYSQRRRAGRKPDATVLLFAVGFEQSEVALDQQPAGTAAWVVDAFAGLWVEDVGHQNR